MTYAYILTCPHNTAQIAKKELEILWYKATIQSSTSLSFEWDEAAIARINLHSRVGNKLFLQLATGKVSTFDDLFQLVTSIDWHKYVLPQQPLLIDANTKRHPLTSVPSIQSIAKKAIINKLVGNETDRWDEQKEIDGIDIQIMLDGTLGHVLLNTTWAALHNRWYRQHAGAAPLKENLAAALVLSSGRKFSTPLIDPFCGAGTIAIEAALIAKNIAPGLIRLQIKPDNAFAFQGFARYDQTHLITAKETAQNKVMLAKEHTIIGYDIDDTMIAIAKDNAKNAWVDQYIEFKTRDFITERELHMIKWAIVTNPPYWERMWGRTSSYDTDWANTPEMDSQTLEHIYQKLISLYEDNKDINWWFITSVADTLDLIQPSYWKQTLYYNGALECRFFKIARL